jgi:predicted amidohydrolase YtcJ
MPTRCLAVAIITLAGALVACGAPASDAPELIMTGGLIYPLGPDDNAVQALAIRGDSILALGRDAEVVPLADDYTQQMNLEEAVVLPGAYDAWIDLEAVGRWSESALDMRLASTVEEAQAMVRNAGGVSADDPRAWLVGWGWDENDWPTPRLPDHEALDATGIDRPIALLHRNGHLAWLNGAALQALPEEALAAPGVQRDDAGEPTGIVLGDALDEIDEIVAGDEQQRREWLAEGGRRAAAAGVTRAATSPLDTAMVEELLELEFRGLLPLRVDVRLSPQSAATFAGSRVATRVQDSALVRVIAVGEHLDGPLASRMAAVSSPYEVEGPNLPPLDREALQAAARAAAEAALPLHLQAAGDAAVDAALQTVRAGGNDALIVGFDLLPETLPADLSGLRVGIAAARFARDIYWLDRVLGTQRAERAHAWADLDAAGVTFVLASDAPAYPLRPLQAVAAAATRQDVEGYPAGGWNTAQALPQRRLVRALVGAAAGLEVGDAADLVVWSEDPVAGDAGALRRAEALLTIVAGRVAYSRALVDLPMSTDRRR